ncbi:MAG: hypothetical protein ACYYK0_06720 [Candidatus Eutrophobiaceae bacterium]
MDYNEDWLMEDQLDSIGNAPISGLNAMPFDPITADGSKSLCNAYFKNSLGTKG